jgi:hypothetical protein
MPTPESSRRNLEKARANGTVKRLRSDRETQVIKLLIWQSYFDGGPRPSQRALARQLGVSQPYVRELLQTARTEGGDALLQYGQRVTLDALAEARRFTSKLRNAEPDILAPAPQAPASNEPRALTTDEAIAETWRIAREEQRKHPTYSRRSRLTVSVRW